MTTSFPHERDKPSQHHVGLRLGLCLLTWNELQGCQHDLPKLPLEEFDEIFAMDGGSTDGIVEYLTEHGIVVFQQDKRGYNQAYISAFRRSTSDALVLFHPKGSVDPEALRKVRPYFEGGYDLVIASRMTRGARNEEDDNIVKPRKWFVMALGLVAAMVWRQNGPIIWDVLHGFRGMRVAKFAGITPLEQGLSIVLEMVVRGYRQGLRSIEPNSRKNKACGRNAFQGLQYWKTTAFLYGA